MDEDWLIQWQRNYMAGGQMQPPTQMSGQQTTAFSQEMRPLMFGGMNGFNGLNGMNAVGSDAIGGMSGLGVMNGMGIQNGIMARMNGGIMGMGGFMGIGGMMGMGAMNGGIGGMTSAFGPAMFSQMQQPSNETTKRTDVLRVVRLHQDLLVVSRQVEVLFSDSIMHYMLCCFSVPLISTLQVLQNDLAFLTFTGAFINLAVFMPLAVLSQRLSDASISVRAGAYSAAMTVRGEETVPVRQALQLVLLAAGRPACLSFKGLGPLTLSSAGNALRAWYSFTNVLVKVG